MKIRRLIYGVLVVVVLGVLLLSSAVRAACPVTAENWHEVGEDSACEGGISNNTDHSWYPSVAISPSGLPYVVWYDNYDGSGNGEIYIRHWNGTEWEEIGIGSATGGGISDNSGWSGRSSLAIGLDETPYVSWDDDTIGSWRIYVRHWNGNIWEELDGSASGFGISENIDSSSQSSIAIAPDGKIYVAWSGWVTGRYRDIYVLRWNGSEWEEIGIGSATGGGISNDDGQSSFPSIVIAPDNTPYVVWHGGGVYIRYWNGSNWEEVGAGSATGDGISGSIGADSLDPG